MAACGSWSQRRGQHTDINTKWQGKWDDLSLTRIGFLEMCLLWRVQGSPRLTRRQGRTCDDQGVQEHAFAPPCIISHKMSRIRSCAGYFRTVWHLHEVVLENVTRTMRNICLTCNFSGSLFSSSRPHVDIKPEGAARRSARREPNMNAIVAVYWTSSAVPSQRNKWWVTLDFHIQPFCKGWQIFVFIYTSRWILYEL